MEKSPLDLFRYQLRILRLFAKICGADILESNYRLNFITWYLLIAVLGVFALTGYTTAKDYRENGDWTIILKNLCTMTNALQGYSKLINAVGNSANVKSLFTDLHAIFEEYSAKHSGYQKGLRRTALSNYAFMRLLGLINVACVCLMPLVTVYFNVFRGMRLSILHFDIPGIDSSTFGGHILLNACHTSCVIFGCFGNYAGDLSLLAPITCSPLFKDIFLLKLQDLIAQLEDESIMNQKQKHRKRRNQLQKSKFMVWDIIRWHQRYVSYLATMKNSFYWVLLVQILSGVFGVAATSFCLLLKKWPGGELFLIYTCITLYIYCALGTAVVITNMEFVQICYENVPWQQLTLSDQKTFIIGLCMCQQMEGLRVGGIAPLDRTLAVQISKTIYSFLTFLISLL